MTVTVQIDFPDDVEDRLRRQTQSLEEDVKRAYVLELFRQQRLSHYELSRALGLDRFETDAYLKRQQVFDGTLTHADVECDRQAISKVLAH